jgi:hypothetical protein
MALEGTLQDMSMSDLFQIFRLGAKSGVLILDKDEQRGVIYVDKGRLIDGFVVRSSDRKVLATADEAVLQMLAWDDATFVFRHDLSVSGRPIQIEHDSEWLVMESMQRRNDPLRTLPYHNITLDTRLRLSPLPSNTESSVSLDVDQWRILSHAANNQDLRSICEATAMNHEKAIRIVAELLAIGLVEIAAEAPTPPARRAPPPASQPAQPAPPVANGVPATARAENGHAHANREGQSGIGRGLLNAIMRRISEL